MRPVRDLWGQLVERRLWPLALALVAALVAVPIVLARPAPPAGDAPPTGAPAVAAAAADLREPGEPLVSVADAEVAGAPLRGRAKDPFKQQHLAKQAEGEGGSRALEPAPATGGGGDPSGGSGGGADDEPPARTYVYASIDVRFGRAGASLREIRDVPRLAPLPSGASPVVIFLGMRGDHETALFMISTDVHAQGDGRCVPSVKLCEAIELREGDIAFLDVRAEDGSITQYELDLVDVALHETTSKGMASRTYARTSTRAGELLAGEDDARAEGGSARTTRRVLPRASAGTAPGAPLLTPLP